MNPEEMEEKAREKFSFDGLYCAETVLAVIAEKAGIQSSLLPRIATGFCSGVARTCGICGAVSGGIMALGILYGRDRGDQSIDIIYEKVQQFIEAFEKKFTSVNCKGLLGCDLGSEEGQKIFKENDMIENCRDYTGKAEYLIAEIIKEEEEESIE